jgi:hypothetical protein
MFSAWGTLTQNTRYFTHATLVRLWIKYSIQQDRYPAIEARRKVLQAQFTEERKKFGFIDEA